MRKLIIERSRWLRGSSDPESEYGANYLCDGQKMCALGHALHKLKEVPLEEMDGHYSPLDTVRLQFALRRLGPHVEVNFVEITNTNDSAAIDDNLREERLKKILKELFEIDLEFTD